MAQRERIPSGTKTIASSNIPEVLHTTVALESILITAAETNAEAVRIGSDSVNGEGYPLIKGDSLALDVNDPSLIHVYGKEGDKVYWIGIRP